MSFLTPGLTTKTASVCAFLSLAGSPGDLGFKFMHQHLDHTRNHNLTYGMWGVG